MNDRPSDAEAIALAIADGTPIDWDALQESGPLSRAELASLRELADLVRRARPTPAILDTGIDLIEEVGRGGYGRVFRARDRSLERTLAVKVLHPGVAVGPDARARFLREARLLAAIEHANVVRVYGIDESDSDLRLRLEWIDGETLARHVADHGPLPPARAVAIGRDLARALAAIHSRGIVHGDVKPSNVMLAASGRVVLLDFGLARAAGEVALGGTPMYLAPEILAREPSGAAADQFALGVLLDWMAAGRHPIEPRSFDELRSVWDSGSFVPACARRPGIPRDYVAIVSRAMQRDAQARFPDVQAVAHALERLQGKAAARRALRLRAGGAALLVLGAFALARSGGAPAPLFCEMRWAGVRGGAEVAPTSAVDGLFLDLTLDRPAHVYVFDVDQQGAAFALYPSAAGADALPAGVHRLPQVAGRPAFWPTPTRMERLVTVVAPDPDPTAESLLRALAPPAGGPQRSESPATSDAAAARRLLELSNTIGRSPARRGEAEWRVFHYAPRE